MAEKRIERRIGSGLQNESLVLVAVMPSPRDLEIARVLGWYRIPFRFAPKIVYVDYLAFYQPSSFGSTHKQRIEFLAPVNGVELTIREELFRDAPEHPRAKERYYKIQIGGLIPLSIPIKSGKWTRITFLYTTGERVISAQTINDLVIKDEERKILWRSLRERQTKFSTENQTEIRPVEIDDTLLMMLGDLHLLSDDDAMYIDY